MASLGVAMDTLNAQLAAGKISAELHVRLCTAAVSSASASGPAVATGGGSDGSTIVTTESANSKAAREVQKEMTALIGTLKSIKLSARFKKFALSPEKFGKYPQYRVQELIQADGVEEESPGAVALKQIEAAVVDQEIAAFTGTSVAESLGRWYFWQFVGKIVCCYAVFYMEQEQAKAFSAKVRATLEKEYFEKVFLQLSSDGKHLGADFARKMTGALKSADQATESLLKVLANHEEDSDDNKKKKQKKDKVTTTKRTKDEEETEGKGEDSDPENHEMNVNGIPKTFKKWPHARQLAWVKPLGLCRSCAENGQKVTGIEANCKKDDHKKSWSKRAKK